MSKKYSYRREDNGKLVKVGFTEAIQQDRAGYITVDGVQARRVYSLDPEWKARPKEIREGHKDQKVVNSFTLGFGECQIDDFEKDRKANGFNGIEFARDPDVPQFLQIRADSQKDMDRYVKHRGKSDKNGINGSSAMLTPAMIEDARELAMRTNPSCK